MSPPNGPGRNAPCPCGSGRKFKHCCMNKADTTVGRAYSAQERQDAFAKLVRFAQRDEFAEERRLAEALFWAGRLDLAAEDQRRELEADRQCLVAYLHWLAFDLPLDLLDSGGRPDTIADRFARSRGGTLGPGELAYLERLRASCIRLYEIEEVHLDEGLVLKDLWTDDRVEVRERLATRQLVRWDLLAVRVIEGPTGARELEGTPYVYPTGAKAELLADLRRDYARVKGESGMTDPVSFFKRMGMRFHHFWLDHVVLRPMPTIVTPEGDPVALIKTVFEITDGLRVQAVLAAHPDLEPQDDGSYLWTEEGEEGSEMKRILATLVLARGRLSLETTSRARAERGRRFLEGVLGDAVRFRAEVSEDLAQALAHAHAHQPPSAMPPEVEPEVLAQFYHRHYHAWLDEPIPALGGRTPRHAATLKTGRPRVIDLLNGLENQMEREHAAGRPAYDMQWMWAELGLGRP